MSTLDNQLFIDAVIVKGIGRTLSVSIEQAKEDGTGFEPFYLDNYSIRFRVLGSADGAGAVLIEKIITHDSEQDTIGKIDAYESGEFTFTVTAEETEMLGLGAKPISIEIVDPDTLESVYTLTEGGSNQGEFSKIVIVRP